MNVYYEVRPHDQYAKLSVSELLILLVVFDVNNTDQTRPLNELISCPRCAYLGIVSERALVRHSSNALKKQHEN